jgi:Holliday junction resolvasome RuvABC ATP-dependent DNA helicase subunit
MKILVNQKPRSSPLFTGGKEVLGKLEMVFASHDGRLMSRNSCLLWGMGGIGKTQICLKFIEEMSDE